MFECASVQSRAVTDRFQLDFQPRIGIGVRKFARSPCLHDSRVGLQFERLACDVSIPGSECPAHAWLHLARDCRSWRCALSLESQALNTFSGVAGNFAVSLNSFFMAW